MNTVLSFPHKQPPTLQEAAIQYARQGFRVFPITAASKKPPMIKDWPNKATTNENQINQWWSKWSQANIGIATGAQSGFFVLDIDSGTNGFSSLDALLKIHGQLPVTGKQKTGSGEHYLFACNDITIKNSAGQIGAGIDIRGDGGYIVAPPSIHPNGNCYTWVNEPSYLSPAPEWLLNLVHQQPDIRQFKDQIPEGKRNDTLFKHGCSLLKKGTSAKSIGIELFKINQYQCIPPLPDSDINKIISSVKKYATKQKKPLFQYRDFVCNETPKNPTLRHILHVISFFMDEGGKPEYPTIKQIAEKTGYSEPTVGKWLKFATEKGFIIRKMHKPEGQKWFNWVYLLPKQFIYSKK